VGRLVELRLLDVIYTTDGKEYITPVELGKEIREELTVQLGKYLNIHFYGNVESREHFLELV